MYTPKGELNERFLDLVQQDRVLEELKDCKDREELLSVLEKYIKDMDFEELQDSMVVIHSYLDEKELQTLTKKMLDWESGDMQASKATASEKIDSLLERRPGIAGDIRSLSQRMQRM